ncbi:MAG: ABC transporter permease [Gemmatimonadetes bacterium]|nr:ABC transporter permease [Gemmatimonadota bacterium]
MKFWEGIWLALLQLRAQKLKSFFTLLGVIIGVTFLISVIAIVQGMNRFVREDFATAIFGVNTLQIHRRETVQVGREDVEKRRRQARNPFLYRADADALRATVPGVWRFGYNSDAFLPEVRRGEFRRRNVRVVGGSEGYLDLQGWDIADGRAFNPLDYAYGLRVAVIGSAIAERLFPDRSPIGERIRVGPHTYTVVGTLKKQGGLLGNIRDASIVIPFPAYRGDFAVRRDVVDEIAIKFRNTREMDAGRLEVEAVLRQRHRLRPGVENDFAIESATQLLDAWQKINRILMAALPGLVSISLVVGGIVIMNIMLVSVLERTREIGIRMAIGARRRDILLQFLIESATLSVMGAAAGVVFGALLAQVVRAATPLPVSVAPWSVAVGVVLGLLVGLFFGAYPASRAARLDPIVALRYE